MRLFAIALLLAIGLTAVPSASAAPCNGEIAIEADCWVDYAQWAANARINYVQDTANDAIDLGQDLVRPVFDLLPDELPCVWPPLPPC